MANKFLTTLMKQKCRSAKPDLLIAQPALDVRIGLGPTLQAVFQLFLEL